MAYRGRLESGFAEMVLGLERGWDEVVGVVGCRFVVMEDGCSDDELRGVPGSGRRGIEFRRGRGRRGLLRSRAV